MQKYGLITLKELTSEELLGELNDICSKWETPPEIVSVNPRPDFESHVGEPPTFNSLFHHSHSALGKDDNVSYIIPSDLSLDQNCIFSNLLDNKEALSCFRENISDTCPIWVNDGHMLEKVFVPRNFRTHFDSFSKLPPIFPSGIG